jgi:hypothetical protein
MSQLREHPADLAFPAFGQDQFELCGLPLAACDSSALGADLAVGKPDPFGQFGEHCRVRQSRDQCAIDLFDAVARMGKAIGQFTVISEDQKARAVLVQPPDCVNPLGNLGQEVNNPRAPRGIEVGGYIPLGLVDGEIDGAFKPDGLAVDGDFRGCGIDARAELAHDLAIYRDATPEDQFLTTAPRAEPGVREDFLKPFGFSGLAVDSFAVPVSPLAALAFQL